MASGYTPAMSRFVPTTAFALAIALHGLACQQPKPPKLPVAAAAADRPAPQTDANPMRGHEQLLEKAKQRARRRLLLRRFHHATLGRARLSGAAGKQEAELSRMERGEHRLGRRSNRERRMAAGNGELDGVNPKVIVLLAGTNNVGSQPRDDETTGEIVRAIKPIVGLSLKKAPDATIILTAIFPRGDNPAVMPTIDGINERIASFADGKRIRFLNINKRLTDANGQLVAGVMDARDKPHPEVKGYQIWADALKPIFFEPLGPLAAVDLTPPPTGDPSAAGRFR